MPKQANMFVSAVLVADKYAQDVPRRVKKLASLLARHYANYELVLLDNGISPEDLISLKKMLDVVPCVRIIRLAKHYDTDTVIFAGIEASIGDNVCVLYNNDPIELLPKFIEENRNCNIVLGVARNLSRQSVLEQIGARIFYWYNKRYLRITVPTNSTYYICIDRSVANALTRSGRFMRHIRHMAQQLGFSYVTYAYELPNDALPYNHATGAMSVSRAIDLIANYSSHPLRSLSYFGLFAGALNIIYGVYVVVINLSRDNIARGWTTLSLQSSLMFFILFMILAVLAEYMGKILNEVQRESPYHIMQELSSTINVADETRRNITN